MNPQSIRSRMQDIVANRTKTFRIERRLTQKELAKRTGLNYTHIGKIENGKRVPSLKTICKLATALQIETHELLIPEERQGRPGQQREQLIKILKESNEKEIEIYFVIIEALRKSRS